jgi:hypothetical protein
MKLRLFIVLAMLQCAPSFACDVALALVRDYGISFAGFDKRLPLTEAPRMAEWERQDYVFVSLHKKEHVSDGFNHTALINAKLRKAWIHRTGGLAGVHQWYGPVPIEPGDWKLCERR